MLETKLKKIYGFGINDLPGFKTRCPIYQYWFQMIRRCYSPSYQVLKPTYIDCSVSIEWSYLSNFKSWMENQDWENKQLDKDLLFPGNKLYSPKTCVFINGLINGFISDCGGKKNNRVIGCYFHGRDKKIISSCRNPFTKKSDYLGYFLTPEEAHLAWKAKKHEHACKLADLETDPRIQQALRTRFV